MSRKYANFRVMDKKLRLCAIKCYYSPKNRQNMVNTGIFVTKLSFFQAENRAQVEFFVRNLQNCVKLGEGSSVIAWIASSHSLEESCAPGRVPRAKALHSSRTRHNGAVAPVPLSHNYRRWAM